MLDEHDEVSILPILVGEYAMARSQQHGSLPELQGRHNLHILNKQGITVTINTRYNLRLPLQPDEGVTLLTGLRCRRPPCQEG